MAYSIIGSPDAPERLTRKIMFDRGVAYAVEAYTVIQKHVEMYGAEPGA